jgi:hypothetical protein
MKTQTIIDLLDEFLRGDRVKRTRREQAVLELLENLEQKEKKLLEKLALPHDADEIHQLNLKLQVNRSHQDKARAALDSWAKTGEAEKTGDDVAL